MDDLVISLSLVGLTPHEIIKTLDEMARDARAEGDKAMEDKAERAIASMISSRPTAITETPF